MDYSRSESGLLLARESPDGPALERELQSWDRELQLQGFLQPDGPILWKVVRQGETVYSHVDERMQPLPLSWRLLDEVRRLDRNQRGGHLDENARETIRQAELEKQVVRDNEALADDWNPKHGRPVLPRGRPLQLSRQRARRDGKPHFG